MSFLIRRVSLATAASLLLSSLCSAGDEPQAVKLHRPSVVGEKLQIEATGEQHRIVLVKTPDETLQDTDDTLKITCRAVREILAVNEADGRPTRARITIQSLTTDDGSGPIEQFDPGTVLTVSRKGGKSVYREGKEEIEGTLADAMELASLDLPHPSALTDDDILGSAEPRKPGDSWDMKMPAVVQSFREAAKVEIIPDKSKGTVHFDKVEDRNGQSCQVFTYKMDLAPKGVPGADDSIPLKTGSIVSESSLALPVDATLQPVWASFTMDANFESGDPGGPQMIVRVKRKTEASATVVP